MKTILSMIANWRTSASALAGMPAAIAVLLAATGQALQAQFDTDPATQPQWMIVGLGWSALWSSISGLFSRDAVVTSEESGIDVPAANRKIKAAKVARDE